MRPRAEQLLAGRASLTTALSGMLEVLVGGGTTHTAHRIPPASPTAA